MDRKQQDLITKGVVKRFGITVLCCIPVLVLIGYWLQGVHSAVTISIFTLFMLVTICIEEYIHIKISAKKMFKMKILHKDEDVFN